METHIVHQEVLKHPIPEILIGFISFNFGTKISNIMCFLLFTLSIILFHKVFKRKKSIHLFVLLILSNSYLFLENSSSVDYQLHYFFSQQDFTY